MAEVHAKLGDIGNVPVEVTIKATMQEFAYFRSHVANTGGSVIVKLHEAIGELTRQLEERASREV